MQQIYRRKPMSKYDFNKVASNLIAIALRHWCSPVNLLHIFSNFIEIALRHGCCPVNVPHIFRTPFPRNIYGWLLLSFFIYIKNEQPWEILKSSSFNKYQKKKTSVNETIVIRNGKMSGKTDRIVDIFAWTWNFCGGFTWHTSKQQQMAAFRENFLSGDCFETGLAFLFFVVMTMVQTLLRQLREPLQINIIAKNASPEL